MKDNYKSNDVLHLPDAINVTSLKDFVQVPKDFLRNPEISAKAKTILSILLSNKDGWHSSLRALQAYMKEGRDAIKEALTELEENKYLLRMQYRDKNTKEFKGGFWAYTDIQGNFNFGENLEIIDKKGLEICTVPPQAENPLTGNPLTGNPLTGNPPLIIINNKNKENNNKKEEKKLPPKSADKEKTDYPDFIDRVLHVFSEEYGGYRILNRGKERKAIGKILTHYKKEFPETNSEEALHNLRLFFHQCVNINDPWLYNNMSPSIIASKFNEIVKVLTNEKTKLKGATDEEIFRAVAKHFAVDFKMYSGEHEQN